LELHLPHYRAVGSFNFLLCQVQDRDSRFPETKYQSARGGVCEVLDYSGWPKEDQEASGRGRHSYPSVHVLENCGSTRLGYKRKGGGVEERRFPVQRGGSGLH
jgi:hypothetical protein